MAKTPTTPRHVSTYRATRREEGKAYWRAQPRATGLRISDLTAPYGDEPERKISTVGRLTRYDELHVIRKATVPGGRRRSVAN